MKDRDGFEIVSLSDRDETETKYKMQVKENMGGGGKLNL